MANHRVPVRERLNRFIFAVTESGCWIWMGVLNRAGYGIITFYNQAKKQYRTKLVHRLTYEEYRKSIPDGLQIDHLCRVRCCVNPYHPEAVTPAENVRRGMASFDVARRAATAARLAKTHCVHGHPYDESNTRRTAAGKRTCIACQTLRNRSRFIAEKLGYVSR